MPEQIYRSQLHEPGLPDGVPARLLEESMAEEAALVGKTLEDFATVLDIPVAEVSEHPEFHPYLPSFLVEGDYDENTMVQAKILVVQATVVANA